MKEHIKHAAVRSKDGTQIFMGKSHADCFHQAAFIGFDMSSKACDQGFMTSKGRYVERPEAMQIALAAGQVDKDTKALFSEDLWSTSQAGTKFSYDPVRGYVPRKTDEVSERPLSPHAKTQLEKLWNDETLTGTFAIGDMGFNACIRKAMKQAFELAYSQGYQEAICSRTGKEHKWGTGSLSLDQCTNYFCEACGFFPGPDVFNFKKD